MSSIAGAKQYFNQAAVEVQSGRVQRARDLLWQSAKMDPGFFEAHYYLGLLEKQMGNKQEARRCLERAVALAPGNESARRNLGDVLNDLAADSIDHHDVDPAFELLNRSVEVQGLTPEVAANLGAAHLLRLRPEEAERYFRRALALRPDMVDVHWNLAQALLIRGEFEEGWKEYEWRWKWSKPTILDRIALPRWDGSDVSGMRLVVASDQALGDMIQMARYVPLLTSRGAQVRVVCQPELVSLMKSLKDVTDVTSDPSALDCDWVTPAGTLPMLFNTRLDSIPANVPYLHADPQDVDRFSKIIVPDRKTACVGIVWAGRPGIQHDLIRSTNLELFAPLRGAGVRLFSLQKGPGRDQLKNAPAGLKIMDLADELNDFSSTAAAIANLDLVIGVGTAVIHLAGAMGKPVWTLLPYESEWRWMLNREDTPWYPTMRLFRQTKPRDWEGVIARVVDALNEFKWPSA